MGHLNRGDLRVVFRQTGTPYRPLTLMATPQFPAYIPGKQYIEEELPYKTATSAFNENSCIDPFGRHGDADRQRWLQI